MLKEIKLKNFKCFREETTFPFSKINLLTGINGRGKSTLLQAILLMKQSIEHNEFTNELVLNGHCVNLGDFSDVKNNIASHEEAMEIYFDFDLLPNIFEKYQLRYIFKENILLDSLVLNIGTVIDYEPKLDFNDTLVKTIPLNSTYLKKMCYVGNLVETSYYSEPNKYTIYPNCNHPDYISEYWGKKYLKLQNMLPVIDDKDAENKNMFYKEYRKEIINDQYYSFERNTPFKRLHFISADRLGGQEYYKKSNLGEFIHSDKRGENIAMVISAMENDGNFIVNKKLYLGKDAETLIPQIGEWLSRIFDTIIGLQIDDNSSPYIINLDFIINGKAYKPTNVGFGYSYILPIIVSGLIAKAGEILIIENPEAHLHPKAQSELTKFLAMVASTGVQIFVESHSEHILNGLRIATIDTAFNGKILEAEEVNILYFDNSETYFKQIKIMEDNDLSLWAEDFFDQTNKDYKTIYGF